jgi:UMF1 family MFS transporter
MTDLHPQSKSPDGIRPWVMADFINSVLVVNGSLYFSPWLVEQGISSFWFGLTFVTSTILLLLILPVIGTQIDRRRSGRAYFFGLSLAVGFAALLLPALGRSASLRFRVISTLVAFGIINLAYQAGLVSYNWLLKHLRGVKTSQDIRRVSGLGEAGGHLGSVAGSILGLLAYWALSHNLKSANPRIDLFLPLAIIYLISFSVDYSFLRRGIVIRNEGRSPSDPLQIAPLTAMREIFTQSNNEARSFFYSFFLFSDALLTVQLYLPIFMHQRLSLSSAMASTAYAASLCAAAIGGWLFSRTSHGWNLKVVIGVILISWSMILILLGINSRWFVFFVLLCVAGFLFGAIWSASRAYLIEIAPTESLGKMFGMYSVFQRCASIAGPLVWGIIMLLPITVKMQYAFAFSSMAILVVLSVVILWRQ